MNEYEIIDNLLNFIVTKESIAFGQHIDESQKELQKHKYIKDALKYLKYRNSLVLITLSNDEWIKRLGDEI